MNFNNLSLSDLKVLHDLSETHLKDWEEEVLILEEMLKEKKTQNQFFDFEEDYELSKEKTAEFHRLISCLEEEIHNRIYSYFKD